MLLRMQRKVTSNQLLMKTARKVMTHLGGGHTEAVYQNAMVLLLFSAGFPCLTEVNIPYLVNGICVGFGRADILTQSHVIELKANQKSSETNIDQSKMQICKYLRALNEQDKIHRKGMLILFNTPSQGPLHKRVTFISVAKQPEEKVTSSLLRISSQKKIINCTKKKDPLPIKHKRSQRGSSRK